MFYLKNISFFANILPEIRSPLPELQFLNTKTDGKDI